MFSFNIFERVHQELAALGHFFTFDTPSTRAKLIVLHGSAYYLPRVALGKSDHKAEEDFVSCSFFKEKYREKQSKTPIVRGADCCQIGKV